MQTNKRSRIVDKTQKLTKTIDNVQKEAEVFCLKNSQSKKSKLNFVHMWQKCVMN